MPSDVVNDTTRKEWQDLGFFYDQDHRRKQWRLVGSRSGLLKFRDLLLDYLAIVRHQAKFEHDHYGPYGYLKILTWSDAGMDENAIYGTPQDLRRLAGIIEAKLQNVRPGSVIRIQEEFAPNCDYSLMLEVRDEDFDPASVDPELLKPAG
jgi:hypothetical protein